MSKLVLLSGLDGNELAEVTGYIQSIVQSMQAMPALAEYKLEQALAQTVLTFIDDDDSRVLVLENAANKSKLYKDYYRSLLESLGSLPVIIGRSELPGTDLLAPTKSAIIAPEETFQPDDAQTRALFDSWRGWYIRNAEREELRLLTFHQAVTLPVIEGVSQISPDNGHNQKSDYRGNYLKFHNYAQADVLADMNRLGFADFQQPTTKTVTNPTINNNMSNPTTAVAPAPAAAPATPGTPGTGPNDGEATSLAKVWAEHKTIILIVLAVLLIGGGAMVFWPKKKAKKKKRKSLNGTYKRKRKSPTSRAMTSTPRKRKRKSPSRRLNGAAPLMLAAPSMPVTLAGTRKKRKKKSTAKPRAKAKKTTAKRRTTARR